MNSQNAPYVSHVFVAHKPPDERELHCWHAHQTDKALIESKIVRNGRVVHLVCAPGALVPRSIVLDSNSFVFKRTEPAKPFDVSAGAIGTISTRLCYTVHRRPEAGTKSFTEMPVDALGRIKPHLKAQFLGYLEKATGLEGLLAGAAELSITAEAIPGEQERQRKVWFNGAMHIVIRARVRDAGAFNRLAYVSIGNRRSYGFGSVSCDFVEDGAQDNEQHSEAELAPEAALASAG
jgi:hypothetical protein